MKTTIGIAAICTILVLGNNWASAKGIIAIEDHYTTPTLVSAASSIDDLKKVLKTGSQVERYYAVKRLAEFPSQVSVHYLVTLFEREPRREGEEVWPFVKLKIIDILGNMKDAEAQEALRGILERYIKEGPLVGGTALFYEDPEYATIPIAIISQIGSSEDKNVQTLIAEIAANQDVGWTIRESAYAVSVREEMKGLGLTDTHGRAKFLLARLTGSENAWVKERPGVKTPDAVKNGAALRLLREEGPAVLPDVTDAIESATAKGQEEKSGTLRILKRQLLAQKEKEQTQN